MGLFSFSDQELADKALDQAQQAWAAGLAVFAYDLQAGIGKNNDLATLLNMVINGAVGIGWTFDAAAPYIHTIGPNTHRVLLTFRR